MLARNLARNFPSVHWWNVAPVWFRTLVFRESLFELAGEAILGGSEVAATSASLL